MVVLTQPGVGAEGSYGRKWIGFKAAVDSEPLMDTFCSWASLRTLACVPELTPSLARTLHDPSGH